MKNECVSIYFHSVANYPLSVPVGIFRRQIKYLKKIGYEGTCIRNIENESGKGKQVLITFDDCFASVYENAVSILEEYGFKATFFATIDYLGERRWGSTKYQRWSDEKTDEFNIPFDYMSWDQLKELADSGMEIGSHTITHRNLTELSRDEQEDEIFGSKEILEKRLGIEVITFCYPRGKFNDDIINIMKKAGYKKACTTIPGIVTADSDPFQIRRFGCGSFDLHYKSLFSTHHRAILNVNKSLKAALIRS